MASGFAAAEPTGAYRPASDWSRARELTRDPYTRRPASAGSNPLDRPGGGAGFNCKVTDDGTFLVGERGATAFPSDALRSGHTSGRTRPDASRDVRARGPLSGDEAER
jgi:hypothetical protein